MKNTKGKWEIKPLKNGKSKVFVNGKDFRGNKCDYDIATCQNMANANLIASAPKMLKSLKLILDECRAVTVTGYHNKLMNIWEMAEEAIAKAEGE
jgi:hypothetical protein